MEQNLASNDKTYTFHHKLVLDNICDYIRDVTQYS